MLIVSLDQALALIGSEEYPKAIRQIRAKRERDESEEEEQNLRRMAEHTRVPSVYRKRWDSHYLRTLAEREGSFLEEYRVNPIFCFCNNKCNRRTRR